MPDDLEKIQEQGRPHERQLLIARIDNRNPIFLLDVVGSFEKQRINDAERHGLMQPEADANVSRFLARLKQ